jgi:hypothetical protein
MTNPATDLAIRLRRAAFNRALEQGDLDAITPILAANVTLVTGTDSALLNGRKAQLLAWKREFAAPPAQRTIYRRTPEAITAGAAEPIAMELGAWQGADASGAVQASGTYAAKWRNLAAHAPEANWVLEAEIFVTLA